MLNVEAETIAYLGELLEVPVYADVPEVRPDAFVTVEQTGGTSTFYLQTVALAVQAWAPSRYEASELAALCREHLQDMAAIRDGIMKVETGAPYNFPESSPRYQLVADITTT